MRSLRIVNNDFTFNNEIERAFMLNEVLAQKELLEKVMEINTPMYNNLMMQVAGEILSNDEINQNVTYILNFFKRPGGISKA
jgi:hypothetical protein